ncbi:hypothetical protein Tco_1245062 [Tanacetum coccineum]
MAHYVTPQYLRLLNMGLCLKPYLDVISGFCRKFVDMAKRNPEGPEWPTQVDIPENDEREETPEHTEKDKHENAHIPATMAKEIKEMISQEIAKA